MECSHGRTAKNWLRLPGARARRGGLPPVWAKSVMVMGKSVGDYRRKSPDCRYERDVRKSSDVF